MNKRMAAIIKMLSSAHDGEVVNAARQLGKMLAAHGKDWNDLGSYLEAWSGIAEAPRPEPKPAQPERPKAQTYTGGQHQPGWKRRADRVNVEVDIGLVQDQVGELEQHLMKMKKNNREFIEEMMMRFENWGGRTRVTVAQADYVNSLWEEFVSNKRKR